MKIVYNGREMNDEVVEFQFYDSIVDKTLSTFGNYDILHDAIQKGNTDKFKVKWKNDWIWISSNRRDSFYPDGYITLTDKEAI